MKNTFVKFVLIALVVFGSAPSHAGTTSLDLVLSAAKEDAANAEAEHRRVYGSKESRRQELARRAIKLDLQSDEVVVEVGGAN